MDEIIGSSEFRRNLYGIYTETKSLTKILDENALEYLASGKGFILDRLWLDILTIIFTRIDVTPKSWTVYLICFDVVSCIVQDSCRA